MDEVRLEVAVVEDVLEVEVVVELDDKEHFERVVVELRDLAVLE